MSNTAQEKVAVAEVTIAMVPESATDTSKKIRFFASIGYKVAEIEKILQNIGVTTKEGKNIRYQHVRNVLMTNISEK